MWEPIPNVPRTAFPYFYRDARPGEAEEEFAARTVDDIERLMVRQCPGDAVAFCPPLIISEAEIDDILSRFGAALDDAWTMVRREGLV